MECGVVADRPVFAKSRSLAGEHPIILDRRWTFRHSRDRQMELVRVRKIRKTEPQISQMHAD